MLGDTSGWTKYTKTCENGCSRHFLWTTYSACCPTYNECLQEPQQSLDCRNKFNHVTTNFIVMHDWSIDLFNLSKVDHTMTKKNKYGKNIIHSAHTNNNY